METKLDDYIAEINAEIIAIRRQIHQNPELSFQEFETSKLIFDFLKELGLTPQIVGKTGVTAIIQNEKHDLSKGCIALRADMDALPITEQTELSFVSQNNGIMHACGHDVHTSVLLGVAKTLVKFKEHLSEPVKLIFQQGEEVLPGGASVLIEAGILKNPTVNRIYGLHVAPELNVGEIGWKKGIYMASCDEIHLTIHGKGGHGALPQNCIDPIVIGASLITNIQQIISRKSDPKIPSVLTFGYFEGLGATNVIPSEVKIKGTFRTFNEEWRTKAHAWISDFVHATCQAHGATADLNIKKGYPFLQNDEKTVSDFVEKLKQTSSIQLKELEIRMTSEDFAYYSQKIPACFFRLGTSNNDPKTQFSVHNPQFSIDEKAIDLGIKAFCLGVLEIL
ncbi:MAG TPA: M20 family metallopeptidase [Crocinitomicaceae bacterium]|nr:M20 family metallopeptidase [Crocinitomicaceae bacterium]